MLGQREPPPAPFEPFRKKRGRPSRKQGLSSLYTFAKDYCYMRDLSPKLHGEMCERISEAWKNTESIGIVIPRDMFKSSIGLATMMWIFTKKAYEQEDCEYRILIDTSTMTLSKVHIAWIRKMFQYNDKYINAYGDYYGSGEGFRTEEIYIAQRKEHREKEGPNFRASGIGAEKTGLHFDVSWYDDLVTERNYESPVKRDKTIRHFYSSLNLLDPGYWMLYNATTWHDGDLTGHLRRQEETLPVPLMRFWVRSALEGPDGKPDDAGGESIFPERFPTELLLKKKTQIPQYDWKAQWMNDPTLPEHAFRITPAIWVSRKTFPARLRVVVATVDPNFRDENSKPGDFGCIVVGGFDHQSNWWGLDVRLKAWTPTEFVQEIIEIYKQWRPAFFRIEKKFSSFIKQSIQHAAVEQMNTLIPIVDIQRDYHSKTVRFRSLETWFNGNRIKFAAEIDPRVKKEMTYEMERTTSGSHDDFLDALSDQFHVWMPSFPANINARGYQDTLDQPNVCQPKRNISTELLLSALGLYGEPFNDAN